MLSFKELNLLCDEIRTELEQSNVTKGKVLGLVENKEK